MLRIWRKIMVPTLIIIFSATLAVADWMPGDGHKMHFPQLPDEAGWDVYSSSDEMLADDWQCSGSGWISDIHFWGSWRNGIEGGIEAFYMYIYADIPADLQSSPYSQPGQLLWSEVIPIEMVAVVPIASPTNQKWLRPHTGEYNFDDHSDYFQYNVFLPEEMWFHQGKDSVYWLGIYPVLTDPETTSWGWKTTTTQWNDAAVYRDPVEDVWKQVHPLPLSGYYDYIPGDVNSDGIVSGADPVYYNCWQMGICPPPQDYDGFYASVDANGDCQANVGDMTYLIGYLEGGGPPPWYCELYPPLLYAPSLDLAFVVNGETEVCDCIPGDANNDGAVNVGDAVYIIAYVFKGGPAPIPYATCSGDANCDCECNVGDAVYVISYVFKGGLPPCDCPTWLSICGPPLR